MATIRTLKIFPHLCVNTNSSKAYVKLFYSDRSFCVCYDLLGCDAVGITHRTHRRNALPLPSSFEISVTVSQTTLLPLSSILKKEAICSSETFSTTRRHSPEDQLRRLYRRENIDHRNFTTHFYDTNFRSHQHLEWVFFPSIGNGLTVLLRKMQLCLLRQRLFVPAPSPKRLHGE